jgi:hypothetical protein
MASIVGGPPGALVPGHARTGLERGRILATIWIPGANPLNVLRGARGRIFGYGAGFEGTWNGPRQCRRVLNGSGDLIRRQMPILAGQAALDIGNHQFLADLGHGDSLRQQAPTVDPCSAVRYLGVAKCSPCAVRPPVGGRSGRGCWSGAGSDARGVVARRDRRDIRQAQSVRQRRPSTNRTRPPSAGETSRRIAASVLRGAPTPRRPLSPIPRNARYFTPSA